MWGTHLDTDYALYISSLLSSKMGLGVSEAATKGNLKTDSGYSDSCVVCSLWKRRGSQIEVCMDVKDFKKQIFFSLLTLGGKNKPQMPCDIQLRQVFL